MTYGSRSPELFDCITGSIAEGSFGGSSAARPQTLCLCPLTEWKSEVSSSTATTVFNIRWHPSRLSEFLSCLDSNTFRSSDSSELCPAPAQVGHDAESRKRAFFWGNPPNPVSAAEHPYDWSRVSLPQPFDSSLLKLCVAGVETGPRGQICL